MSELKRVKIIVEGRVQGIGYRWFVQEKAQIMRINGWVKNRPDGGVEVLAEGSKKMLEELIDFLSKHPYAEISSINSEWENIQEAKYKSFIIAF